MVNAIITAAGKSSRMFESQKKANKELVNKLLLPLKDKTVIETTIDTVLSANVDSCIIVLGYYKDEIMEQISHIDDPRIKIIENKHNDVGLSTSLLNGLSIAKSNLVLCTTGDQPTIIKETFNELIFKALNSKDPFKTVSILRRRDWGELNSAEGLGMPFVTSRENLMTYFKKYDENINPIVREMFKDGYYFYGVREKNKLELVNINTVEEYEYVLKRF